MKWINRGGELGAPALSLKDRVEAQRAIEAVYHSHQIGTAQPFDVAMPPEIIDRKVRTYLKQSAALEKFWGTPVTGEALRAELEKCPALRQLCPGPPAVAPRGGRPYIARRR